ncbi:hypothetical protein GF367_03175 [Candidatus Woesearchaeota archaeon]|nr:hypothetical protein [Candidatus Woesearchaeota archaeon]
MLTRDAILAVLQQKGPCLPIHIKQAIGQGDTFTIGAFLTELREVGKIKVSNTKRDGSPFYYVPEHAPRLVQFLDDLGEKDRRTAHLLKEKKLLQDDKQEPLIRVSLRQIKDFAVPVNVKLKDKDILFWKWYLVPNDEAEALVKRALHIEERPPTLHPVKQQASPAQAPPQEQEEMEEEKPRPVPAAQLLKGKDDTGDKFMKQLLEYFAEKRIQVITKDIKRKGKDIEFELSVPTAVGRVDYFCKAKSKKKSNDGDLSSAYVHGQGKKLPVLYITTGKVTKKVKEKLKNEFKGLVLVEL